jgi:uncharacterized protein (TIGR00251 family)
MPIRAVENGVTISLRVLPRSPRTQVDGVHDGALRLRVSAPPVEGAANAAIIDFLRKQFKVRKSDIEIIQGETSRQKVVFVAGIDAAAARKALGLA